MSESAPDRHPSIIPGLRYTDAPAAIEWLCETFGFEATLVVPGEEEGTIAHAGSAFDEAMRPPSELDGHCTQGAYVIVEDADAHHERALAAGAEILLELVDQDYGGRGYTCRDPQGHVWSFGTYGPWADD
jgi:uncharacterized glyoxalase superfamily protein PhnB